MMLPWGSHYPSTEQFPGLNPFGSDEVPQAAGTDPDAVAIASGEAPGQKMERNGATLSAGSAPGTCPPPENDGFANPSGRVQQAQPQFPGQPPPPSFASDAAPTVVPDTVNEEEDAKEYVVQRIVENAIEKAVKAEAEDILRSPDAPAAMAAKLRNRPSGAGGSTDDLGSAGSQKQAAAPLAHHSAPLPPPPGQQRLPQMMSFASLQHRQPFVMTPQQHGAIPVWMHERDIPLWFIRQYEEIVSSIANYLSTLTFVLFCIPDRRSF